MFKRLLNKVRAMTPKQMVVVGVFTLALAGAVTGGLLTKQFASADQIRDCGGAQHNSIDNTANNGGCGAADANEFILDAKANQPGDLQTIYSFFGLTPDEYDRFKNNAKQGTAYRDGRVVVDGQVVMTDGWSIGRQRFSYSKVYPIPGAGSTYSSWNKDVLNQDLPVMVMFDDSGNAEFAVINACGNPVGGNRIPSSVTCNALVKTQDKTNPNKYTFTTDAAVTGNAKISKVVYTFSDGTAPITKSKTTDVVEHTFTKSADVTVTVYATVPGGKEIQATVVANCKKHIDFKAPMFACTLLTATMPDPKDKRKFRFTVSTSQDPGITVKSADFILDDTVKTSDVTTKDNDRIFKEYTFTDEKEHTVKATVFFNTFDDVKSASSDKCIAKATAEKIPPCTSNPNLPECKPPEECKPGIPKGDARCTECKPGVQVGSKECAPLPNTGPGSVAGLFAGASIAGTAAHRIFLRFRGRNEEE